LKTFKEKISGTRSRAMLVKRLKAGLEVILDGHPFDLKEFNQTA